MNKTDHSYLVIFERQEDGGYTVTVPALRGVVTEGDTLEEAREMAREAIALHLECLREDGIEIPESDAFTEHIIERVIFPFHSEQAPPCSKW